SLEDGEPAYDIVADCAYDAIELKPEQVPTGSIVYHGTLAIRSPVSRLTLDAIIRDSAPAGVFLDVNLRPPWWDGDSVMQHVGAADWVKLNHDELRQLGADSAGELLEAHQLKGLVVTMGAEGAQAWTDAGEHLMVRPAASVSIVDTVGAGDAFTAVIMLGIVRGWPLAETLERAQAFASQIVGQRGATVHDRDFYAPLIEDWGLS
ncbi:MAG: PfkB family carbohydrate kinase, partial [Thiohalobacterales bacterium]|nr:PfkB family carbohydrate kinase [Thiohalobacterales bacterium]